jgi:peptide/nickel transport system substrate-binding protein
VPGKKNATTQDPWAVEVTKNNGTGGGAYRVSRWQLGTEVIFERFDAWKGGPLPKLKRVIWRTIPSAGNRRALLEHRPSRPVRPS